MATETKQQDETDKQRRERSTIAFPYGDLDGAVEVAKALNDHGGMGDQAQLVAWMGHKTVDSGTFKVKLYSARSFGLITIKESNIALTDLGNEIVRPDSEARSMALAFLSVPLYRAIYDKYKGRLLPGDAVLEADMVELGVAPKQKSRARQGFQRSAEQAKLGKDRLVMPGGVSLDSKANGGASRKMDQQFGSQTSDSEINPLIASWIEELPASGEWTRDERDSWIRVFQRVVDKLYKVKE
ncbi:MAG: hypothetical protein WAU82_06680 [Candidatus Binatus sp.]|uniref:hypothetical protein n=1 Tax=Candidatus Binatus sp. TaxID=2811406 RepID=UPI003BAE5838